MDQEFEGVVVTTIHQLEFFFDDNTFRRQELVVVAHSRDNRPLIFSVNQKDLHKVTDRKAKHNGIHEGRLGEYNYFPSAYGRKSGLIQPVARMYVNTIDLAACIAKFLKKVVKTQRQLKKRWKTVSSTQAIVSGSLSSLSAYLSGFLAPVATEEEALKIATHRHYKGGLYAVLAVAKHTETEEDLWAYVHVWPHKPGLYVRPKAMFEGVNENNEQRFKMIGLRDTIPDFLMQSLSRAKP